MVASGRAVSGLRLSILGIGTVVAVALALGMAASPAASDQNVEEWPLLEVPEPSGVAYHPSRKTLFVVGDQGHAAEVGLDGRVLGVRKLGGDLEGVVCDGASGAVYAVREGADVILELAPDGLKIVREISISRAYKDEPNFIRAGGDGIEGITLRPEAGSQATLFAVNQFDPPVLLELALPPRGARGPATIRNAYPLTSSPLSDVSWDQVTNAFVIVSAIWRNAHVVSSAGADLRSVRLPGIMQEGIARLPDGSFVITQDTGGLLKWRPPSDPFAAREDRAGAASTRAVSAQSDSN
jgi:hypothetical protein